MKVLIKIIGFILLLLVYSLVAYAEELPVVGPFTLTQYLKENYTYQEEKGLRDHWKTPEETILDKGGDCEDFAILTKSYLDRWGYAAHLVYLKNRKLFGFGHAVCVFELFKGKWAVFDNQYLLYFNADSIEQVLSIYKDEYGTAYLINLDKSYYQKYIL